MLNECRLFTIFAKLIIFLDMKLESVLFSICINYIQKIVVLDLE